MKRIILLMLTVLCLQQSAKAANGDTTWVQAHSGLWMDWYNNFDTAVAFPDGSLQYRKIFLTFTLGKYACPGSPQYCGDWDYDVHTYVMTPTDTFELARLITPYAHTGYGRFAANWTHDYVFDVSDYYKIMKDSAVVRILYSGYSGGFTANVKFAFVEGMPERNVLGINRIWNGGFNYGHGSTPINDALTPLTQTPPIGTTASLMDMWITGHGGDDNNCAEFCPNQYALSLNGLPFVTQNFWRDNCPANDIYPQSGTWVYNRANWCPGDLIHVIKHNLNGLTAGSPYTMNMTFPAYTSTTGGGGSPASYKIDGAVFHYGTYNKAVDAAIEDIIAPSNAEVHFHKNPLLGKPEIHIRNSGGNTLTSIKFEYGIVGMTPATYTWSGSLVASETDTISLPELADLKLAAGNYSFAARILEANGGADEDSTNNKLTSSFTAAPKWPADFYIKLYNSGGGETQWRIEDMNGTVVEQNNSCANGATCIDTLHLMPGMAYKMIVSDTIFNFGYYDVPSAANVASPTGDGLYFFSGAAGYFRVYKAGTAISIPIPAAMTGSAAGNFGFGFTHYFYTDGTTSINTLNSEAAVRLDVFPNPSAGMFTLDYQPEKALEATYQVTDIVGHVVAMGKLASAGGEQSLDLSGRAAGVYLLQVKTKEGSRTLKLTIQ